MPPLACQLLGCYTTLLAALKYFVGCVLRWFSQRPMARHNIQHTQDARCGRTLPLLRLATAINCNADLTAFVVLYPSGDLAGEKSTMKSMVKHERGVVRIHSPVLLRSRACVWCRYIYTVDVCTALRGFYCSVPPNMVETTTSYLFYLTSLYVSFLLTLPAGGTMPL